MFTRGPRTVGGPEVRVLPDMRAMFSPNLMIFDGFTPSDWLRKTLLVLKCDTIVIAGSQSSMVREFASPLL